jgi:hypothetical protein
LHGRWQIAGGRARDQACDSDSGTSCRVRGVTSKGKNKAGRLPLTGPLLLS